MCLSIDVPLYFTDNNQSFLFSLFLEIYCPLLQATKHNFKSIESIQLIILYYFEFADFLKFSITCASALMFLSTSLIIIKVFCSLFFLKFTVLFSKPPNTILSLLNQSSLSFFIILSLLTFLKRKTHSLTVCIDYLLYIPCKDQVRTNQNA